MRLLGFYFLSCIECLNPYYIGRYSMSMITEVIMERPLWSLNPYYIGRYSMRSSKCYMREKKKTCLNPYYIGRYSMRVKFYFLNTITIFLSLLH